MPLNIIAAKAVIINTKSETELDIKTLLSDLLILKMNSLK